MSAESLEDLRVDLLVCDDAALLAMRGEIDFSNRGQLDGPLAAAVSAGLNVTIDLADVSFMDVGSAKLIASAARELQQRGWRLQVVHPQGVVRRVFFLLGADHLLRP
jgi:anti-anti-sigma factor